MTADEESIAAGTASSIKTLTAQHSSANRSMLSLFRVYVSVKNNAHVFFSLYFFFFPECFVSFYFGCRRRHRRRRLRCCSFFPLWCRISFLKKKRNFVFFFSARGQPGPEAGLGGPSFSLSLSFCRILFLALFEKFIEWNGSHRWSTSDWRTDRFFFLLLSFTQRAFRDARKRAQWNGRYWPAAWNRANSVVGLPPPPPTKKNEMHQNEDRQLS